MVPYGTVRLILRRSLLDWLTCVAPERRRESFPEVAIGPVYEVVHVPSLREVLAGDFVLIAGPVLVFSCAGGVLSAGSVCSSYDRDIFID